MKYKQWNKALQEYFNFSLNDAAHPIKLALTIHSLAEVYEKQNTNTTKDINEILTFFYKPNNIITYYRSILLK